MKAKKAEHSIRGQETIKTEWAPDFRYVTSLFRKRMSWNAYKRILLLAAFLDCQFLVVCPPQTWVKTRRGPGYVSKQTITYDGPNPSALRGYEQDGFTRVPNEPSTGFDPSPGLGSAFSFDSPMGSDRLHQIMLQLLGLNDVRPPMPRVTTMRPTQGQRFGGSDSDGNWGNPGRRGSLRVGNGNIGGWNRNGAGGINGINGMNGLNGINVFNGMNGINDSNDRINPDEFAQECLIAHNEYRARHKVPPLKLNNALSRSAMQWAQHLASRGSVRGIYHSGCNHGENISAYQGYIINGRTSVDAWYDEIEDYDFRTGDKKRGRENKKIGHLTQVLWKDSKELGVAFAKNPNGSIFVVCHYDPPGNIGGQFTRQVPPVGGFTEADLRRQAEEDAQNPFQSLFFAPMPYSNYGNYGGGYQFGGPVRYSPYVF